MVVWANDGIVLIERGQRIAGLSAVTVRKLMRSTRTSALSVGRVGEVLSISRDAAVELVAALQASGYIEPERHAWSTWRARDEDDSVAYWQTTVRGNALAKARVGKPMPRAKAEGLLQAFLDRVREANADPDELFWVDVVYLYGSLTDPEQPTVGDVDLLVVFGERHGDAEHLRLSEEIIQSAETEGRSFPTWLKRIGWPQERFERRLGRGPLLDVQFDLDRAGRTLPDGATVMEVYRRAPRTSERAAVPSQPART